MAVDNPWASPGKVIREWHPRGGEMDAFRYADGSRMERGDRVSLAGGECRIVGWDIDRALVLVAGKTVAGSDGVFYAEPGSLERVV